MKKLLKDKQLMEFENKDLGEDVKKSGSAMKITPKQKPTSIFLPPALILKLKNAAIKKGIGYQTMLKIILNEQLPQSA